MSHQEEVKQIIPTRILLEEERNDSCILGGVNLIRILKPTISEKYVNKVGIGNTTRLLNKNEEGIKCGDEYEYE